MSVLIPAYNEEAGLARCVDLVLAKLDDLGVEAELLIVDDGSSDRTGEIADELAAKHERVRAFHHPVNRGIGAGFVTGVSQARGEWLILIPADLALDLDELHKYLDASREADIVVGIRSDRSDYTPFRRFVSWTNIRLIQTLFGMKQRQFNYISMYRLDVLREIEIEYWRSAFFFAEILIKAQTVGRRLVEVEIRYVPRASGRATGAKPGLIARTVWDMFRFWLQTVRSVEGKAGGAPANTLPLTMALLALGLALVAQSFFVISGARTLREGVVFYALAAILFLVALERADLEGAASWSAAEHGWRRLVEIVQAHPIRSALLGFSLALTYTNWRLLQSKQATDSYVDAFVLWSLATLSYIGAFSPARVWFPSGTRRLWIAIGGLVTLALVLRIAMLDSLPAELHIDETVHTYVATRVLEGKLNNMFATWQSDGTMHGFVMAIPLRLLGIDRFSIRLLPALAGTLTVALVFLLGFRLFDSPTALLASVVMATSHFHLHFSRSVVTLSIYDALLASIVLGLLYHGLETRSHFSLALSGLFLGLSMYAYVGARVIVLIVMAYLGLLCLKDRESLRFYGAALFVLAAGFLIVAAPMLLWARQHPEQFWYSARAEAVLLKPDWLRGEAQRLQTSEWSVVLDMIRRAALTLNYYPVSTFYEAKLPQLDLVGSALFVLGLVVTLRRLRERRYLLLFVWLSVSIVVGGGMALFPERTAYRLMVAFPAVCLLIGLGLSQLIRVASAAGGLAKRLAYAIVALLVLVSAVINLKAYFLDFGPNAFTQDINALAGIKAHEYAGQLGGDYRVYFLGLPRLSAKTYYSLDYLSRGVEMIDYLKPLGEDFSFVDEAENKAFIVLPERTAEIDVLRRRYPGGAVQQVHHGGTLLFTVYRVP